MQAEAPEKLENFKHDIIEAHNRRRRTHGSADLRHSSELDNLAQHWAERLAEQAHLSYSELSGVGENITFFPKNLDPDKMVEHWYEEHERYEYDTPGWQQGTNYFTQVVWRSTEEIGIGRAYVSLLPDCIDKKHKPNGNIEAPLEQVVVAFYRPAGNNNRAGQFAVNVVKPRITAVVIGLFGFLTLYVLFGGGSICSESFFNVMLNRNYEPDADESTYMHTSIGNLTFEEIEGMYRKKIFKIASTTTPILTLYNYLDNPTCDQVFFEEKYAIGSPPSVPPETMPEYTKEDYLSYGYMHLIMRYTNESEPEKEWKNVDDLIDKNDFELDEFHKSMKHAMRRHPPSKKNGIVFDSSTPWLEATALYYGAKHITTVRFKDLKIEGTDKVEFKSWKSLAESPQLFYNNSDFVAVYLSLAQKGMGRGGDGIDPWGDLKFMLMVKCLLKPGGLIYLTIPRGQDTLVFNSYRIYGRVRLPMLFQGFELVATFRGDSSRAVKISYKDYDHYSYMNKLTMDTYVLKNIDEIKA